ncbi:MAG TPA: NAD(P)/FAD-dependent oxidoreductase [Candidatus Udaeobacter sp.]|nr:NAD(P)/FAD-dependent oxidoreductase [Candidatus Udaeobacter sp.]
MPHTPLAKLLRRAASAAAQDDPRNAFADDSAISRREFIRTVSTATAGLALPVSLFATKPISTDARVVVVGAGLAGLTCAYRLKQSGVIATVYEANTRVGGRCWTRRADFDQGQIAEHGGELIDQGHTAVRHLAQELGLRLDNLLRAEPNGSTIFLHFDGAAYSYRDAVRDLKKIWQPLHRDLVEASYPTLYNNYTTRGAQLDQMSITDWINQTVPGGLDSALGQLLEVAYTIEYGAECDLQSALNLIYLLGYNSPGQFTVFGQSNEKYHVRGGNDQIVSRLADSLGSQLLTGQALAALRRNPDGTYRLTFQISDQFADVTADHVVLALPFSILKNSVDLTEAGFSELKKIAIQELAMGSNSKLNLQFDSRPWAALRCNGETYSDRGYQATWEVSRAQTGNAGILVNYTGAQVADTFGNGTPEEHAAEFLAQIEPALPGLSSRWNGRATVDWWAGNPYTRGSYSYWQVGQYTRFAGIEGEPEGAVHFCGEHTSIDAQGYLEGAVETGERVADEIISALR